MNNFGTLVGFEYKKILYKKSVIIAIVLAFAITIFACFAMVIGNGNTQGDYYTDGMSNYESMQLDQSYGKALSGRELDSELILEASRAYQKIDRNVTPYFITEGYQKYARPYSSVYTLIDSAYAHSGNAFNVDDFRNLSEEDASNYYTIREKQLRENLTNHPLWSSSDVDKVLELDKDVQKPFIMEYTDGYNRFFGLSITTMMAVLFLISFMISPIFSGEYSEHTDSLILTAKNGKKSLIYAKIFTSISISFVMTLIFALSTYFTCMGIYGFDGTHAQIQLIIPLLTYDFTLLETTVILIMTSLLGAILHTTICIAISAVSKKTIMPMAISSILIVAGMFGGLKISFFEKARYFLPLTMGSFYDMITQLIVDFFGIDLPLYQAICIVSIIISILLSFISFKAFRNHQVS